MNVGILIAGILNAAIVKLAGILNLNAATLIVGILNLNVGILPHLEFVFMVLLRVNRACWLVLAEKRMAGVSPATGLH